MLERLCGARRRAEQWGLTDPRPPFEHFELEPWAQPSGFATVYAFPVHVARARSHSQDTVEARLLRTEDAA